MSRYTSDQQSPDEPQREHRSCPDVSVNTTENTTPAEGVTHAHTRSARPIAGSVKATPSVSMTNGNDSVWNAEEMGYASTENRRISAESVMVVDSASMTNAWRTVRNAWGETYANT